MLSLISGACAVGTILLAMLAWRLLRPGARSAGPRRFAARRSSPWQWLACQPVAGMAQWLAPCIPVSWRAGVADMLERADLDQALSPEQWLMAPLLGTIAALSLCHLCLRESGTTEWWPLTLAASTGAVLPWLALRDRIRKRQRAVLRDLPGYLDLLALALEAGCAFSAALQLAVQRSPPSSLRAGLERVLQEVRAGSQRGDALRRLDRRVGVGALAAAVAAIAQAESTGVSLAPVIRAQALRCTQQRFARAEKLAMEAPVKMLGPLVLCIFPCTFIVIGFPIAVRLLWGQ
jgi:tight adherence protein C